MIQLTNLLAIIDVLKSHHFRFMKFTRTVMMHGHVVVFVPLLLVIITFAISTHITHTCCVQVDQRRSHPTVYRRRSNSSYHHLIVPQVPCTLKTPSKRYCTFLMDSLWDVIPNSFAKFFGIEIFFRHRFELNSSTLVCH